MNQTIENFHVYLWLTSVILFSLAIFLSVAIYKLHRNQIELNSRMAIESIESAVKRLISEQKKVSEKIIKAVPALNSIREYHANSLREAQAIGRGISPPVYSFDDPESLKLKIGESQNKQLDMALAGNATEGPSRYTIENDELKGGQMIAAFRHLMLKAFNEEFDVIRKQMRHNSFPTAFKKLNKLEEQLDNLGEPFGVALETSYFKLKEEELKIWHGDLIRRNNEKEERKANKAKLKAQGNGGAEDEIDEIEYELEVKESELRKAQALAQVLMEGEQVASKKELERMVKAIQKLKEKKEKTISQAQLTRAGYVYVISNIGCFGHGVCKIGMTRRVEPMERVNELGDASVPFRFDVHTLVFVEDAPSLEKELHNAFHKHRVNIENNRKEFFRVSPEMVEEKMKAMGLESSWYFDVEAKEYRESKLIRRSLENQKVENVDFLSSLPESI